MSGAQVAQVGADDDNDNAAAVTVAEREAELLALQSAFDEYIASSRELEEELDAELAKMQEKLAESTAANAALSGQLENISPQLTSLESALSKTRTKLKKEQLRVRELEQINDEAETKIRTLDESLQSLRDENDAVHEELAFKENELEETRLELEVEKQQLENDIMALKQELLDETEKTRQQRQIRSISLMDGSSTHAEEEEDDTALANDRAENTNGRDHHEENDDDDDDGYVKKLEEELELVTEQLIETEKRLSEAESELVDAKTKIDKFQKTESEFHIHQELLEVLEHQNADLTETNDKLKHEMDIHIEELALCREEITLQNEEMQNLEQERQQQIVVLEKERQQHKDSIHQIQIQLRESQIASKSSIEEAANVAKTVNDQNTENGNLQQQVLGLESALENSKKDYQNVLEELEQVNSRFDEVRMEAEETGRERAKEELRTAMELDSQHELQNIQENLICLRKENELLQEKVDQAELALANTRDQQQNGNDHGTENGAAGPSPGESTSTSEVVQQLQGQLQSTKEELVKKEKEMSVLIKSLEERLVKAEDRVTHLESELHNAKGQLAEAEAHLIVLKRERKELPDDASSSNSRGRAGSHHDAETTAAAAAAAKAAISTPSPSRARSSSPSSVMKLELKLAEETKRYNNLEKDYNELQDQKRMGEVRIKRLEEDIKSLQKQLFDNPDAAVVTQMSRLSSLGRNEQPIDLITNDEAEGSRIEEIIGTRDVKRMVEELQNLEQKCNSQREYNAQLLSKMLHLQGNIQVYCRIRPLTVMEIQSGSRGVVDPLSETEVGCFDGRTNKWKSFAFDRVWGPDQTQTSVFQDVEPLALSVVDGFNACIFAYGQTGSGKTYTMEGLAEENQYGISYRTIQKIFHLLNLRAQQQRAAEVFVGDSENEPVEQVSFSFTLKVGMLEIYNDDIYDLLATAGASMEEKKEGAMKAGGKASLDIRRNEDGRVEVPNLTKEKVTTIEEVMELLMRGNSNRATASTDLNEHSSRSHMVLSVDVVSGLGETSSNKGTLYLVDLAGSERVRKSNVEGENLKEAGFINKSLSALGNVMEALDRKSSHVPYRDSKLTYLLQNALGGNSRTMMVVTICPNDNSFDESVHALHFATRVRRIQIGSAQRNVTSKNLEETVKALTEEMKTLTRAKERTEGQLHSLKRDNTRVQDKLNNLSKARAQGRTDSKTLEVLRKNNDEMAARWQKEKTSREETSEELDKARKELRTTTQQLSRYKSKLNQLEQKLEDKECALERANDQLRTERNQKSAASVRSRREEVLSSRIRTPTSSNLKSKSTTPKSRQPSKAAAESMTPTAHSVASSTALTSAETASPSDDVDVSKIREQVLELLEKHDKAKIDRIDIIMDKFKGKEALLLEKMTQRYEAGSKCSASSIQSRNEMALERHQERMRRIHEKRAQQKSNGLL